MVCWGQQLVACQVSPTSWLHITHLAANEFETVNNIVKDTRQVVLPDSRIGLRDWLSAARWQVVQQQAAFDIEKHRHQVAAYMGGKLGEPRESSAMILG